MLYFMVCPALLLLCWCDLLVHRSREGETDMYFSGLLTQPPQLRLLRTQAGGELYIAVGHEVRSSRGGQHWVCCQVASWCCTLPVQTQIAELQAAAAAGEQRCNCWDAWHAEHAPCHWRNCYTSMPQRSSAH
jgi:hypothetical protein